MSILVVDDNEIQRLVLKCNLRKNDYDVEVAASVAEALAQLKAKPDIRLIISDIMMPDTDGLELLRQLKQDPEWESIPVIICSALADTEHVQRAVRLGCRYYLVKPVESAKLLQKVKEALESCKTVLLTPAQVMETLGLDASGYSTISRAFRHHLDEQIALVEKILASPGVALPALDYASLGENAVMLGAKRLAGMLQGLQTAFDAGSVTREDYRRLLSEMRQVGRSLATFSVLVETNVGMLGRS